MAEQIVKLPDVGEGVAEAEIVEWLVAIGDRVAADQPLAGVQTDKVTVEIPSPYTGRILALGCALNATLAIGAELVRIEIEGDAAPAAASVTPALHKPPVPAKTAPVPPPESAAPSSAKPLASPAVRRRAEDAGLDLRQVRGTGPAGRIAHADLDAALRGGTPAGVAPNMAVTEIKLTGMSRVIAQRMAESTRLVAHFSYIEEVDVTAVEDLRTALNAQDASLRITVLPFLVRAMVRAIGEFPAVNALYDDEADIVRRYGAVHVGIATQTPSGLMVPVLRHAETKDIRTCATEIARLATAARAGTATREALTGSTITITSLGALGGLATTPVINRPEVAIVGVNKIAIRPAWRDGGFVPRKMMNLSSSFDHRIIDGDTAARFVQRIRGLLEQPALLFMEP